MQRITRLGNFQPVLNRHHMGRHLLRSSSSRLRSYSMVRFDVIIPPARGLGNAPRTKGVSFSFLCLMFNMLGWRSDYFRKHEARHRKLFKCDESGCPRKEGFGTINDLARHKKCVHNQEPERGPKMMYMCYGKRCPRPNKKWPRLDNFKQHLGRMHGDEDADMLLKR